MHNLKTNFDKMLDLCKQFGKEFTNKRGNIPRRGVVSCFSDLEVIALSLTAEALSIDSENLLFVKLSTDYKADYPHLISRRQYNDRRKYVFNLTDSIRLDFFETAHIRLEVPYRNNQKDFKPRFKPFRKLRKRVETVFSQLDDQFLLLRNYAKDVTGIFTRVLAKIASMTALQYLYKINDRPIGRVRYALC